MNKTKRKFLIAFWLGAICLSGNWVASRAESGAKTESQEKAPWTIEDIVMAESAGQFELAPDAKRAVWVKSRMDKEKDERISNIHLTFLETKKEIQLTRGSETHSSPRWSPDGEWIAFLSSRPLPRTDPAAEPAPPQLWLLNSNGGEPQSLTEFRRSIQAFEWADRETIVFSAEEDPSLYEQELKKKKDKTRVVDDVLHTPPVRLFRLAVKDRKVTRLTENTGFIRIFALSPDGKMAVTVEEQNLSYEWDQKIPPRTYLYRLETGERQEIFSGTRIRPVGLVWAKTGAGFYAAAPFSTHPQFLTASILLLYYYDLASATHVQVDLGWENGLTSGVVATPDGFLALLADGARNRPARYLKIGAAWKKQDIEGGEVRNIQSLVVSPDGKTILYELSAASRPGQWFKANLVGNRLAGALQITDLNPDFKNRVPARTEIIRWKGALDEEVEGILYYPQGYEPGKKYPLFTAPHGGPAGADLDVWDESYAYAQQLLCQRGAFVFKPNYHGSSNYGLKWVESICCGKYYELPVKDIEAGVDFLIARGLVDPERIATFGWSNGSILSIALSLENPDRYKAVSAGAGDVEWISDWANVDFGHAFDTYYFGKSPLEDPELYLRLSPLFKLDRLKAPTIIFFGTEDRNVPTSQGWTHYRALYHLDKTVRFLLFPGEPHGLRKLSHQRRKLEEELAWFDRYFFQTEKPANEALLKDSPLAQALRRRTISRDGLNYGVSWVAAETSGEKARKILIPEVVKRGRMEIGRFEVTRAQFAVFDPDYPVEPGKENFPANGISFDRAKAYVEWLSKTTGQVWRLPEEDEIKPLYEGRSGENTLDYWAGYAVNPDDARRLEEAVGQLGAEAPLLKEVGNFAGVGKDDEELVFDLGGNVAEWVMTKDGKGKLMGGSADRPADPKMRRPEPDPAYSGFRVVRGSPAEAGGD